MKSLSSLMNAMSIKKTGERTCEVCGSAVPIYERNGEKVSRCLKCDDQKLKDQMEAYRIEREHKATERLIEKYEIPPYNEPVTFDDYVPETESQNKAKQIAMKFSEMEQTTLFMQGKPGVGKTHLTYCVADNWQGTSLFMDMPGLSGTLKNSYNYNSTFDEEELMRLIANVDLFVLDDIGAEYVKKDDGMESWVTDVLYRIINSRQGKRNIYTTNYKGKELQQKYGNLSGRIISRMMANAKIVKIDGQDYRLKGLD